jgi:hypothetical protein
MLSSFPLFSVRAFSSSCFTFCSSRCSDYSLRNFYLAAQSYWLSWLVFAQACICFYSYSFTLAIQRLSYSILGQSSSEALREKHYCYLWARSMRSRSIWLLSYLLLF